MKIRIGPVPTIVGCLVIQLCVGIIYLWSVFRGDVAFSFEWADSAVKMVSSYMLLSFVFGNLVGGYVNDKKGPRFTAVLGILMFAVGVGTTGLLNKSNIGLMYFTYCLLGGLGSGIAYGACISGVQKWLPHRRGLASGLAVCAFGLSTVVFSPVSKWLISHFKDSATGIVDFAPVFFILAGVFCVLGLIACIFVRLPDKRYLDSLPKIEGGKIVSAKRDYTLGEAVKTVPFWCIFFFIFFINGTWNLSVPLIQGLGMERGLSESAALLTVSLTGIANAAGRLSMATLSDKIGREAADISLSALTVVGAIFMTFIGGYAYTVVILLIAFGYGGPAAINPAISTDFFGAKYSGTNYGILMLALGFSSVFFNMISNTVLKGAVMPTFIMGAATAVISIVFMLVIRKYSKKIKSAQ